jgi:hypothetical protein
MKTKFIHLLLLAFACCVTVLCQAQNDTSRTATCSKGICTCGNDPSPAGLMISHTHSVNEWMLSYRFMSADAQDLIAGGNTSASSEVLNRYASVPEHMKMQMHMLMAMYGISERFTFMAMLNYNQMNMQMAMQFGNEIHHHHMRSSGVGDSKFYLLYAPVKTETWEYLLFGGVSMPTGSIRKKGEPQSMIYSNARMPYGMQNGSGSWEVLPGLNIRHQKNDLTFCYQSSAILRLNSNSLGYRLGNEFYHTAWAAWQWCSKVSNSIRVDANYVQGLRGRDQQLQTIVEPQANTLNYGGTKTSAYFGLNFHFKKAALERHLFSAEFGLPVFQKVNGLQLKSKSTLFINWSVTI